MLRRFHVALPVLLPTILALLYIDGASTQVAAPANAEWSSYQRDAQHTGRSDNPGPTTKAIRLMSNPCVEGGASSIVLGPTGLLYMASGIPHTSEFRLCVLTPDGSLVAQSAAFIGGPGQTPAVAADGSVYIAAYLNPRSTLYAFNSDGTLKWTKPLDSAVFDAVTIGPDALYVASGFWQTGCNGQLLALSLADGSPIWTYDYGCTQLMHAPTLSPNGDIVVAWLDRALNQFVSAHQRADGALRWSHQFFHDHGDLPPVSVASDGTIYAFAPPLLHALTSSGATVWSSIFLGDSYATPPAIAADGSVRIALAASGTTPARLLSFLSGGQLAWERNVDSPSPDCPFNQQPSIAIDSRGNSFVVFPPGAGCLGGTASSLVAAFDQSGTLLWSETAVAATAPALALSQTLYVWLSSGTKNDLAAITSAGAAAPTVSHISPSSGPTSGGTPVTVTGTGFITGAALSLGGVSAMNVIVDNSASIRAITPAHIAGPGVVDALVTNPDGQVGTLPASFTFFSPPLPVPVPFISISDAVPVFEENSGTVNAAFTVSLTVATTQQVTVAFATADLAATAADSDYVAATGTVTFAPGSTSQDVIIQVIGDTKSEFNELFEVNLTHPTNGVILLGHGQGIGEIINDDPYVLLIHGWCGSTANFGRMGALLGADLSAVVLNFEYATGGPANISISERKDPKLLARQLALYVQQQKKRLGSGQVDIVAHSMGGLIARAWISGLTSIPYQNEVRRLIIAGTPNFGIQDPGLFEEAARLWGCDELTDEVVRAQVPHMLMGSAFLKELNSKWEAGIGTSVRPQDILTVVGCTILSIGGVCLDDGLVDAASAALPVEVPSDYKIAYVRKNHATLKVGADIGSGIVDVQDRTHETYQLVRQFLQAGNATGGYQATLVFGLIVAPLETSPGVPYVGRARFDLLWPCTAVLPWPLFNAVQPVDSTGWWTVARVPQGCWQVQTTLPKSISPGRVKVARGRPTSLSKPLIVR